ncbi:hypothetical protein V2J94_30110 [Streptomyces sp. DSM 41524]|uniref:GHMP kinase C-terminal domain-containing protein n=1 Tax=Streptomyces asiaticus subsp. ignotus TaxID=3098222 RepID=A0ABU7Q406_9ACTN|nr:hypothetical protein [Streptomyces sp. DSM 41524]
MRADNPFAQEALRLYGKGAKIDLSSRGDAPAGCGLGTSAAFCVALLAGLNPLWSRLQLAESASALERTGLNRPVGSQDHYLSALAGFRLLRFPPGGAVETEQVDVRAGIVEQLNEELLLFYTGVTRDAAHVLRHQDSKVLSGNHAIERRLHAIKELTVAALDILAGRSLVPLGEILGRHWELKKGLSSGISLPEVDVAYRDALSAGCTGGKLLGAGGGGFLLLHVPARTRSDVRRVMERHGFQEKAFSFSHEGPRVTWLGRGSPVHGSRPGAHLSDCDGAHD